MVAEVEIITGHRPRVDEFLSAEATDRLAERYLTAARSASAQRTAWPGDQPQEVRGRLVALAEALTGATAYWLHRLSGDVGAVLVPVDLMLRDAARTFAPGDHDVILLGVDAADGMRLAWDHLPDRDEYELVCWGAFLPASRSEERSSC